MFKKFLVVFGIFLICCTGVNADTVKIGLNYPKTGPYSVEGEAQLNAAELAVEEINSAGGISGKKIQLITRDSQSKEDVTKKNVEEMIDNEGCEMIFGGAASSVAIAAGKVAKSKGKLFFGTLTYSNATTCEDGHKYIFRECYDAWMGARVLGQYLREKYLAGKRYFYITADYTWGWTTEASIRKFSNTSNKRRHRGIPTPFPNATDEDFRKALKEADSAKPDVLVLVLFGKDMSDALKIATEMGLKEKLKAVVAPNLTLGMAESAGPKAMEGVIGALPWCWEVPYIYGYEKGIRFVEKFASKYNRYPCTSSASAYTILYQYKDAVERAGTFETKAVVAALEGYKFSLLKDDQTWRKFDHQCVQTVYAVRCKPEKDVLRSKFRQDYFEIVNLMPGQEAARDRYNWERAREKAGKPIELEW